MCVYVCVSTGNRVASGLAVRYKDENGDIQDLRLSSPETGNKRPSMAWVAAMQKVLSCILSLHTCLLLVFRIWIFCDVGNIMAVQI